MKIFLGLSILFSLCNFAYSSQLTNQSLDLSKVTELSKSKRWHNLLHYKHRFPFGTLKSRILQESPFFISTEGGKNPEAEMLADINAFEKGGEIGQAKQHPQCAFPARYHFLKKELNLQIKDVSCKQLNEFLTKLNPKSITLIFSSAFPSNPGSMFGHTFFRVNSKTKSADEKKIDLLDYGVSFAASIPEEENGLAFAFFGLTGGYYGRFSIVPYYVKVAEYINNESRDLWEYELNLSEDETKTLLEHLWEIDNNALFPYFFLDENCAFILLAMLEVVKPDWSITNFPIYVIPAETIKKVADMPGAIVKTKFRPSLRKKMLAKYDALSSSQKNVFFDYIDFKNENTFKPTEANDIASIETATSYLFFLKQKDSKSFPPEASSRLKQLLIKRSELGQSSSPDVAEDLQEDSRPDKAHYTYRLGTASGLQKKDFFQDLHFKFAFHDLLNDDTGYIKFSQIDFPSITLRYVPNTSSVQIEEIGGLALTSLNPITRLEHGFSWKFNINYYSAKDYNCLKCHLGHADVAGGFSVQVVNPNHLFYAFASTAIETGESLRMGYRVLPQLQLGLLSNPVRRYKLFLGPSLNYDPLHDNDRQSHFYQIDFIHSIALSQSLELRAGYKGILRSSPISNNYNELKFSFNFYF